MIHTSFPRVVAPYLPVYVAAALHHLHVLYPTFVRYYLMESVPVPNTSEGEPIELYKLITGLVDFVSDATCQNKSHVSFDEGTLGKLVNALVQWSQMTKENVSWLALLRGSLTTCAFRRKNGPQTQICSYLKRRMKLRCTACGSLYSIYSRCVLIEDDSHTCLTYPVQVSSIPFTCSNSICYTHFGPTCRY